MNMQPLKYKVYRNGYLELPNGQIMTETMLVEQIFGHIDRPLTREQIREVLQLFAQVGLEEGKKVVGKNPQGTPVEFEFIDDDLDTSRNPALNN